MNAETVRRYQLLVLAGVGAIAFVLWELRYVWALVLVAFIVAAALLPVVDWINRRLPRIVSILLVYIALIAIVGGALAPGIIPLVEQTNELGSVLSSAITKILSPNSLLATWGISASSLIPYLRDHVISLTLSAFSISAAVVSVFIISIYLLYDWHAQRETLHASESRYLHALASFLDDARSKLGLWVHGQIVLSAIVGVLVLIALLIIGIPFAPVLAVFAGLCEFIPYAGPFIAAVPAVLLGASQSLTIATVVGLTYLLIQQVEAHLIVPLVMKNALSFHPIVVIVAILLGFEIMGIIGALLAMPVTVVVQIALTHVFRVRLEE